MNEYRQNAINHLKTHLGCVSYRDYLITELKKLDKIEQIIKSRDGFYLYDNFPPFQQIKEVLEQE